MCQAFSAIVTKKGKVLWQLGVDSHSKILATHKIKDDTAKKSELQFARIEITPHNRDYLHPDKWEFHLDERIKPDWWNIGYEQLAWDAQREWQGKLNKILVRKPIVHPFQNKKPPKRITKKHLALLQQWDSVGDSVWDSVGDSIRDSVWASVGASVGDSVRDSVGDSVRDSVWDSVGASVGDSVRDSVGDSVWDSVGDSVWDSVGASVWDSVGASVWDSLRDSVWDSVGASVRDSVWAYTGTFCNLPRMAWKYTESVKTKEYPFQPLVDLWELGLIPSFDGKKWRLHGGKDAEIVWEGEIVGK